METVFLAADTVYGLIFLVAGVLAALQSQRDLKIARTLVIVGAAVMSLRWGIWSVTTESSWPIRGMVGALIGAALFILAPAALHWISGRLSSTSGEQSTRRPDNFLHLACERADFILPTDGNFYHLEAIYDEKQDPVAQFGKRWVSEYAAKTGPHILPGAKGDVYKCKFTNYSSSPIFNLKGFVRVEFMETIKSGGGMGTRGVLATKNVEILIPKIENGAAEGLEFYVSANSSIIVIFHLPTTVEIQPLGGGSRETVHVIVNQSMLALSPKFGIADPKNMSGDGSQAKPKIDLAIGNLRYVIFRAEVSRNITTKKTDVQMMTEVRNATDKLMYFHARLNGNVSGKSSPNGLIEFDGNIPAGDTRRLMYDRIFDVPTNEDRDSQTPVLSGTLDYDVKYWIDPSSPRIERRSAKRVEFSMWRPFDNKPSPGGEIALETTVRLSNEIEE